MKESIHLRIGKYGVRVVIVQGRVQARGEAKVAGQRNGSMTRGFSPLPCFMASVIRFRHCVVAM